MPLIAQNTRRTTYNSVVEIFTQSYDYVLSSAVKRQGLGIPYFFRYRHTTYFYSQYFLYVFLFLSLIRPLHSKIDTTKYIYIYIYIQGPTQTNNARLIKQKREKSSSSCQRDTIQRRSTDGKVRGTFSEQHDRHFLLLQADESTPILIDKCYGTQQSFCMYIQ